MFNDQPKTSLQRAVGSIEYVLRHEGAQQMKSYGALNLNIYQYFFADIIVLLLILLITCFSIRKIVRFL